MRKQNVLFLCTANSARSQMAEALLRWKAGDRFDVYSAGIEPGTVNPYAIRAMGELGISMEGQRSKGMGEYLGKLAVRYLITVCDGASKKCPSVWPGAIERMHWSMDDPAKVQGSEQEDRKSTRLNSSHTDISRMPSSA